MSRVLPLDAVQVEQRGAVDGQGKPSYLSPVDIVARVIRETGAVYGPMGVKITTVVTMHVPPDAALLPGEQDRVTWVPQGQVLIVAGVKEPRDSSGNVVYRKLLCRLP